LIQLLHNNKVDLIFIHEPISTDISQFEKITYMEDNLAVILPVNHPLASTKCVSVEQIRNGYFIQTKPPSSLAYDYFLNAFHTAGIEPTIVQNVEKHETLIDLVGKNQGISIFFKKSAEYLSKLNPNVTIIDLVPAIRTNVIVLHGSNVSSATQHFLEYVKQDIKKRQQTMPFEKE
jgi:DNA-binding transcriptional LysR family regulator